MKVTLGVDISVSPPSRLNGLSNIRKESVSAGLFSKIDKG